MSGQEFNHDNEQHSTDRATLSYAPCDREEGRSMTIICDTTTNMGIKCPDPMYEIGSKTEHL